LPTTKSRCQTVRFGPVDEFRIIEKLETLGLEREAAQYFARLAQGSLGTACQWAELELGGANLYQTKKELLRSLAGYQFADSLDLAQELLEKSKKIADVWTDLEKATSKTDINRRALSTIVLMIISALHDAMRRSAAPAREAVNSDQKEQIASLAARFDAERAAEKIADCYRMLGWIESSVNEKLIFEQLLLSLVDSDTMKV
jgi:DNA polymerase III gamma/tau subunit